MSIGDGPEIPKGGGTTPVPEDEKLLDAVASRVVRMGMAVPAIFFLESTKPFSYIGSQGLVFLEPFVKSILNLQSYDRFVALLEDRQNIERLLRRIEDLDEAAQAEEKARKRAEKEQKRARSAAVTPGRLAGTQPGLPKPPRSFWTRLFRR